MPSPSWSQQTGPQRRLKTRPPYLQQAMEEDPLRGIISARPELLIRLVTRPLSLDFAWRRDKSRDGRCFRQTKMNGSGRWGKDTSSCARAEMSTNLPADLTSSAHFLQMLDLMLHVSVITNHMVLGRNSSGVITLARVCVLAWDVAPEGWAH